MAEDLPGSDKGEDEDGAPGGGDGRFRDGEPRVNGTARLKGCRLGRHVEIGEKVVLREVELGDYSYFERHCEAIYAVIGKFCSIASHSRINALAHPMERVTTHKISYRPNEYFRYRSLDADWLQARRERRVTIGHDVWIGHGAVILPGAVIGTGAVIGANAVIRGSVEPYEIVGGVPARRIRHRFAPALIDRLMTLRWWDFSEMRLFDAVDDMRLLSTERFLDRWEEIVEREGREG